MEKSFKKKKSQYEDVKSNAKKSTDLNDLQSILEDLDGLKSAIIDELNIALDVQNKVDGIYKDMDDCCIPGNIDRRKNEVEQFSDRIAQIQDEFKDVK